MEKENYRHLKPTFTHAQLVKAGYVPHSGPDGWSHYLSQNDQLATVQQWKQRGTYGSWAPFYKFGGNRLATAYWKKSEIAWWLNRRYSVLQPHLVRAAEAAGYVIEGVPASATRVKPKPAKKGDSRKVKPRKVTLPERKWCKPAGDGE